MHFPQSDNFCPIWKFWAKMKFCPNWRFLPKTRIFAQIDNLRLKWQLSAEMTIFGWNDNIQPKAKGQTDIFWPKWCFSPKPIFFVTYIQTCYATSNHYIFIQIFTLNKVFSERLKCLSITWNINLMHCRLHTVDLTPSACHHWLAIVDFHILHQSRLP